MFGVSATCIIATIEQNKYGIIHGFVVLMLMFLSNRDIEHIKEEKCNDY